ncbi:hypothetical protein [Salmonella enterica]|uniref:hypothetical protein n=1 Tax=Salmonella enterica TaxID=28901 RepID=UPI000B622C81|nr:hypothetical protein [Salmonella enterica]ASD87118.1 hypothetical protein LFZ16_13150 [Salmonella enterica subsp. enterica serovar India str. SA20085604]
MKNETVLDALRAMGKSTARAIASRLEIRPIEALEMLREQEELAAVRFLNGFWSLTSGAPAPASASASEPLEPMKPTDITDLLSRNGTMTTTAIASVMGRSTKEMLSSMKALERKGIVVKNGERNGRTWSLPPAEAEAEAEVNQTEISAPSAPAETAEAEEVSVATEVATELATDIENVKVAALPPAPAPAVVDIPVFIKNGPGSVIIPAPAEVAKAIRKAKRRLRELEQIRQLAIKARKHRKVLALIPDEVRTVWTAQAEQAEQAAQAAQEDRYED